MGSEIGSERGAEWGAITTNNDGERKGSRGSGGERMGSGSIKNCYF